jgi:hypothetical protein
MRQLSRPHAVPMRPRSLKELIEEGLHIAHHLRQGLAEPVLQHLDAFKDALTATLGLTAQKGRGPQAEEALGMLNDLPRCLARGDLIALADVLEHRLVPVLRGLQE